jgi:hypothetical protein
MRAPEDSSMKDNLEDVLSSYESRNGRSAADAFLVDWVHGDPYAMKEAWRTLRTIHKGEPR